VQSENSESFLNKNLKVIIVLLFAVVIIFFIFLRNIAFQSTHLLKSFGELSVDPLTALNNNKPTFLEFYAEWCEVCKEMAPKVAALKEQHEKDINFVFLNVDNQKWDNYIRKFGVNGIPQVNLFDNNGNLVSTLIGKQEEIKIRDSIDQLKQEAKLHEKIINNQLSIIKKNKNNEVNPRSHG